MADFSKPYKNTSSDIYKEALAEGFIVEVEKDDFYDEMFDAVTVGAIVLFQLVKKAESFEKDGQISVEVLEKVIDNFEEAHKDSYYFMSDLISSLSCRGIQVLSSSDKSDEKIQEVQEDIVDDSVKDKSHYEILIDKSSSDIFQSWFKGECTLDWLTINETVSFSARKAGLVLSEVEVEAVIEWVEEKIWEKKLHLQTQG